MLIKRAKSDYEVLHDLFYLLPTREKKQGIVEFAESTYIMVGQYAGAQFEIARAPYVKEPLEAMAPESGVEKVVLMWAAQTGKTNLGEIGITYYMAVEPSEIMIVLADDNMAKKVMNKRITPKARRLGIEFRTQSDGETGRSVSNTMISKVFPGGNIDAASARSPSQLSSETKRTLYCDEMDRWPREDKKEGDTLSIAEKRTQAWGMRRTIIETSTPTIEGESLIEDEYMSGDRRKYHVPCPHCGEHQILHLFSDRDGGLTWENTTAGRVRAGTVRWVCGKCGDSCKMEKLPWMLKHGKWIPTATPKEPWIRSYHLSSFYSPFKGWDKIASEYNDALASPELMRVFTNTVLGLPYREKGIFVSQKKAIEHRGTYPAKEPPNDVLWISAGADVQKGKEIFARKSDDEIDRLVDEAVRKGKDPWLMGFPRIEVEVLGHGAGYRTWSIEYRVFYGRTDDAHSGAFEKMAAWLEESQVEYTRPDGSNVYATSFFVDSGHATDVVYSFCDRYPLLTPSKGNNERKKNIKLTGDDLRNWRPYQTSKMGGNRELVTINTNHYKSKIYTSLKIERTSEEEQKKGFSDHPRSYPDYYFKMLTAEEKRADGSFHDSGRRNEALDCKVYALCAGEKYLDDSVEKIRQGYIKNGTPKDTAKVLYDMRSFIHDLLDARAEEMRQLSGD